jgi:hypothetical protein
MIWDVRVKYLQIHPGLDTLRRLKIRNDAVSADCEVLRTAIIDRVGWQGFVTHYDPEPS